MQGIVSSVHGVTPHQYYLEIVIRHNVWGDNEILVHENREQRVEEVAMKLRREVIPNEPGTTASDNARTLTDEARQARAKSHARAS